MVERTANVQSLQCEGSGVFREDKGRGEAWNVGMRREDELKHEGGDRDQTVCSLRGCGQVVVRVYVRAWALVP